MASRGKLLRRFDLIAACATLPPSARKRDHERVPLAP